jgi:hypothetical protein
MTTAANTSHIAAFRGCARFHISEPSSHTPRGIRSHFTTQSTQAKRTWVQTRQPYQTEQVTKTFRLNRFEVYLSVITVANKNGCFDSAGGTVARPNNYSTPLLCCASR